jgi:murein L,D-transpeptidase YafK
MNKLIYRSSNTNFNAEFVRVAEQLSHKLTFNTRDEYLVWVKQWKEDYKNLANAIRNNRFVWKHDMAKKPERIAYFKAKLDKAIDVPSTFYTERISALNNQLFADTGTRAYSDWKTIAIYLLLLRKAGKIRAERCYQARKAQEALV